MASSSIQFKGIDSVLEAFENRGLQNWSIWQGKQFLFPHVGESMESATQALSDMMELLSESSNAIYTLKVYEDVPGGKIKSNTPDDGSFNFKLNLDQQGLTQAQYSAMRNNNELASRLEAIEQRLSEPPEEKDPENNALAGIGLGQIGNIISHPAIQPVVTEFFTKLLTGGNNSAPQPSAAINGVGDAMNDNIRINNAVAELKKHDAKLPEHLEKLAKIAVSQPSTFQFLLTTIDKM